MHEVVVTAAGIVSPIGAGMTEFRRNMFAGHSGVVNILGSFVSENFPVPFAAIVPEGVGQPSIFADLDFRNTPDSWRFAGLATEEALAAVQPENRFDAIVYGSPDGSGYELFKKSFLTHSSAPSGVLNWDQTRSEMPLEILKRILEQRGYGKVADENIISINGACASGNQAIGIAFQNIRAGIWTRAIVGGVDTRCKDHNLMSFFLLGAVTTADVPAKEASRPFSKDRSGFVRAEGAGTLVLESKEAAMSRGATILGEICGYSSTSDAFRLTVGRPDASSIVHAMDTAIRDAAIAITDISAISAHGTSTPLNDHLETKAIKSLFGDHAYHIPITSLKSQIGHAGVAAGVLEAASCLLMLEDQTLAPTINLREVDPELDLDFVPNRSRRHPLTYMLSNNFGFGGHNACLVLKRHSKGPCHLFQN